MPRNIPKHTGYFTKEYDFEDIKDSPIDFINTLKTILNTYDQDNVFIDHITVRYKTVQWDDLDQIDSIDWSKVECPKCHIGHFIKKGFYKGLPVKQCNNKDCGRRYTGASLLELMRSTKEAEAA